MIWGYCHDHAIMTLSSHVREEHRRHGGRREGLGDLCLHPLRGYFKSKFCCDEMRWAFENKKPIVSTHKMGVKVGAILNTAPEDFRERIMAIDSIPLNGGDPEYFNVGMGKITTSASTSCRRRERRRRRRRR